MPKPYSIAFTDLAKTVAEASSSLAAVEAKGRAEIDERVLWAGVPGCEMDLPSLGFHCFEMPDGQEYIAAFHGDEAVINAIVDESVDRIEDK
jgi:hypothetical protein